MTEIFRLEVKLSDADFGTHKKYYFNVDKDAEALTVVYRYTPKDYADDDDSVKRVKECYARYGLKCGTAEAESWLPLKNLVTISVDDEFGCRGNAHRHLNDAVYVIGKGCSAGFTDGKIKAGVWSITLSAHCILSKELNVSVEVFAND